MAIVFAFIPVAIAIFVIIFVASIGRPRTGAMLYAILCATPLLLLRQGHGENNKAISYAAGIALPGAAGFLSTGEFWVGLVTAALGGATVALYFFKKNNISAKPKLNTLGQDRLNADLRAAGYDQEVFL